VVWLIWGPRHTKIVNIHIVNPLLDSRWDNLVARHPKASAFHQRGWLEALARTYGYEPLVLTTTPAGEPLENGLVLCRVSSWITGTRLVSLPFADHCEPLVDDRGQSQEIIKWLRTECDRQQGRYVELRPLSALDAENGLQASGSYWFHELDLRPSLDQIFQGLHKNSFRRKIHRAETERVSYEQGRSEQLVEEFYRLVQKTRRRHRLMPQPRTWFRNLVDSMGDKIQIRLARKSGTPIAAILTLRHRSTVIYKYGCSDTRFHHLGGMPLLFWRLIEESKASGAEQIDWGRSDLDNQGLIVFKDRLGARRKSLTYYRYTRTERRRVDTFGGSRTMRQFFSLLPDVASSAAARVFYRHIG
jgi:CelD/BcsL family acetyltransferase involved in cellulose biosynthesis